MDKRTLTALQGSIEKWQRIEKGEGHDAYMENCPLCQEFVDCEEEVDGVMRECLGCPVEKAGHSGCGGSPWSAWNNKLEALGRRGSKERIADTPELVALARAEREFLESLLPKETPHES